MWHRVGPLTAFALATYCCILPADLRALGMKYLAKEKIVHRDLKPGNIMVSRLSVESFSFPLSVHILAYFDAHSSLADWPRLPCCDCRPGPCALPRCEGRNQRGRCRHAHWFSHGRTLAKDDEKCWHSTIQRMLSCCCCLLSDSNPCVGSRGALLSRYECRIWVRG
jgi:serine/threonine protein kinase